VLVELNQLHVPLVTTAQQIAALLLNAHLVNTNQILSQLSAYHVPQVLIVDHSDFQQLQEIAKEVSSVKEALKCKILLMLLRVVCVKLDISVLRVLLGLNLVLQERHALLKV
jgi:hypothetical protein